METLITETIPVKSAKEYMAELERLSKEQKLLRLMLLSGIRKNYFLTQDWSRLKPDRSRQDFGQVHDLSSFDLGLIEYQMRIMPGLFLQIEAIDRFVHKLFFNVDERPKTDIPNKQLIVDIYNHAPDIFVAIGGGLTEAELDYAPLKEEILSLLEASK
jgi:hypothetical protein